jgi:hypothetical protein
LFDLRQGEFDVFTFEPGDDRLAEFVAEFDQFLGVLPVAAPAKSYSTVLRLMRQASR